MIDLFETGDSKGSPQTNEEISNSNTVDIESSQLEGLGLLDFEKNKSKGNLEEAESNVDTLGNENLQEEEAPIEAKDDSNRMEYWQSKADKLQAELNKRESSSQDMAIYEPIIKAIKEHPDILEQLENRVTGKDSAQQMQSNEITVPKRPVKPSSYDPSEAVNDPDSDSYKYREELEEYRDLVDQHREKIEMQRVNQMKEEMEAKRQNQIRESNLNVLRYEYGWTNKQIMDFEQKMMNPDVYNIHNLARYYTHLNESNRQKEIRGNKMEANMNAKRKVAKLPNMPESAGGEGTTTLSDADVFNLGLLGNKR